MIIFPCQLDSFRISKIGDRTLTLHTYEQHAEEVGKLTNSKMGKEYIAILIPTENKQEIDEFRSETPEETKERFRRRMNAIITDIAKTTDRRAEELREEFKTQWKADGLIKESTNELDIAGLANIITKLTALQHGR